MSVSWLDVMSLLLLATLGITGAFRGAVRTVVTLVAMVIGVSLAGRYGSTLGAETWPGIEGGEHANRIGFLTGYVIVFVGVLVLGIAVARLLAKLIKAAELGPMDKVAGFIIGLLKGSQAFTQRIAI